MGYDAMLRHGQETISSPRWKRAAFEAASMGARGASQATLVAAVSGQSPDSPSLVPPVGEGRPAGIEGGGPARRVARAWTISSWPGWTPPCGKARGLAGAGGSVDLASGRRGHRTAHRRAVSPGSRVVPPPGASGGRANAPRGVRGSATRRPCGGGSPVRWPAGQKHARGQRAWLVFEDESGILAQVPVVRRTWAPRGETPVLTHAFNWQRMSVAVALAFRWNGRQAPPAVLSDPGRDLPDRRLDWLSPASSAGTSGASA